MDTNTIIEFAELAKRLNVTETARALNMAQPTLSKHIQSLEKELHLPLFERSATGLRLTRTGADLLPFAYKVIEAQGAFLRRVNELKITPPPHLTVSGFVNEEIVSEMFGYIISSLGARHGTNFLDVKSCHHKYPPALLNDHNVDIVFDYGAEEAYADNDEVGAILIGSSPWIALVKKGHRLASRTSIALDDLRTETLVKIEGSHLSEAWRYIEQACLLHGFSPKVVRWYSMKQTDLITTSANLENNVLILGINFLSRVGVGVAPFCAQIPIVDDDAVFPIAALYRFDNLNPMLDEAIEVIQARADQQRSPRTSRL